jgi:hypothetical protein
MRLRQDTQPSSGEIADMSAALRYAVIVALALAAGTALAQEAGQEDAEILEQAAEEGGTETAPPPEEDVAVTYSGIGLSKVSSDFDNLDDAINLDVALGIRIPTVNWFAMEVALAFTVVPGENRGAASCGVSGGDGGLPIIGGGGSGSSSCEEGTRSSNDLQMNNVGVFGVLRSPGKYYLVGKYGFRYITSSIDEIEEGDDQSGTAYAGGVGYRWGRGLSGVELVYNRYSSQLDYIGFNIAYGFGANRSRR